MIRKGDGEATGSEESYADQVYVKKMRANITPVVYAASDMYRFHQ